MEDGAMVVLVMRGLRAGTLSLFSLQEVFLSNNWISKNSLEDSTFKLQRGDENQS
jgi:hypothetical protein